MSQPTERKVTKPAKLDVERAADVWHPVEEALPKCSMEPNSFGVQVLVWPRFKPEGCSEMAVAFYGCRQTDMPNFYMYGRPLYDVTHWRPLPKGPQS